jgi:hypothetical protein
MLYAAGRVLWNYLQMFWVPPALTKPGTNLIIIVKKYSKCESLDSYGGEDDNVVPRGSDAVYAPGFIPAFRRNKQSFSLGWR